MTRDLTGIDTSFQFLWVSIVLVMDPNYRRRSHEDEFMLFVLPTIEDSSHPSSSKNPIHTSKLSGAERVHEILIGHESLSKRNFRMEVGVFQALVNKLREKQLLADSRAISVEVKVAIFLYALVKNASNETLQYEFWHSGETISRHFGAVLDAITQLTCVYIRPPSLHPHQILRRLKFHPFFQGCVDCIDGTHIPMILLLDQQEPYRNRKQTLSQNVMLACDFDLKFVHVHVHAGWEGSASDARVLQDALNHGFEVPPGKFFLVDAGYANTTQFLAPYRGTRYHLQEQGRANQKPRDYKELFNLRHAQLRNHIERAVGILKMRFPILRTGAHYPVNKQVDITVACCVLHNFIRLHNGDMLWPSNSNVEIDANQIVDVPNGDLNYNGDTQAFNNSRQAGNQKRDDIARRMWDHYITQRT
ncbi:uncharacterized protein [Miscanthus floridulus]|uniref:uncharacterized protein n=1 Tax=Miscanthus floridulus TaxID=154761 RepID=UPI003457DF2C